MDDRIACQILGVSPSAGIEEISDAYIQLKDKAEKNIQNAISDSVRSIYQNKLNEIEEAYLHLYQVNQKSGTTSNSEGLVDRWVLSRVEFEEGRSSQALLAVSVIMYLIGLGLSALMGMTGLLVNMGAFASIVALPLGILNVIAFILIIVTFIRAGKETYLGVKLVRLSALLVLVVVGLSLISILVQPLMNASEEDTYEYYENDPY